VPWILFNSFRLSINASKDTESENPDFSVSTLSNDKEGCNDHDSVAMPQKLSFFNFMIRDTFDILGTHGSNAQASEQQ
jgi:hypothetical protein